MKPLRGLGSDLEGHLQETKRELFVRFAGDPESKVFVDLFLLGMEDIFQLGHELKTQVAVIQDYPLSCLEACINELSSRNLHLFTH